MPQSRPRCLLVVEDEALLRMLLETVLEDTDYDFRVLTSAGTALDALEREAACVDALVTNVNLGDAMTGFDIARRARELNPNVVVIYMSGDSGHRFEAEKVPGALFLAKPFQPDALLDLLHQRLGPPRPAGDTAGVEQRI